MSSTIRFVFAAHLSSAILGWSLFDSLRGAAGVAACASLIITAILATAAVARGEVHDE